MMLRRPIETTAFIRSYFGKSVGGGSGVDGESSSENWGYAFFLAILPEAEPKQTRSNILTYPGERISNLLKKKTQAPST
jgi:hypothetical protein